MMSWDAWPTGDGGMKTPKPHELPDLIGLDFAETVALGFIMSEMEPFKGSFPAWHPEWEKRDEEGWGQ